MTWLSNNLCMLLPKDIYIDVPFKCNDSITIMETAPCETDPFKPPTHIAKREFERVSFVCLFICVGV